MQEVRVWQNLIGQSSGVLAKHSSARGASLAEPCRIGLEILAEHFSVFGGVPWDRTWRPEVLAKHSSARGTGSAGRPSLQGVPSRASQQARLGWRHYAPRSLLRLPIIAPEHGGLYASTRGRSFSDSFPTLACKRGFPEPRVHPSRELILVKSSTWS